MEIRSELGRRYHIHRAVPAVDDSAHLEVVQAPHLVLRIFRGWWPL